MIANTLEIILVALTDKFHYSTSFIWHNWFSPFRQMGEKDLEIEETSPPRREDETKTQVGKVKKKKKVKAEKRGVCHVSRVPPRMDHVKLRPVLSQFGEIQRIYLVPEG